MSDNWPSALLDITVNNRLVQECHLQLLKDSLIRLLPQLHNVSCCIHICPWSIEFCTCSISRGTVGSFYRMYQFRTHVWQMQIQLRVATIHMQMDHITLLSLIYKHLIKKEYLLLLHMDVILAMSKLLHSLLSKF